jgi:hypothetical protein
LCVPESQNAPNLLRIFLFCVTTYWATVKVLWVIHIRHSQVLVYFGGWGRGELSTFQESLMTCYSSPPPHLLPNRALSGACFACFLTHNSVVHELANEPSH